MKPITPGEILLEDYWKPLGVTPQASSNIVVGRRSITPEMSIRCLRWLEGSYIFR